MKRIAIMIILGLIGFSLMYIAECVLTYFTVGIIALIMSFILLDAMFVHKLSN